MSPRTQPERKPVILAIFAVLFVMLLALPSAMPVASLESGPTLRALKLNGSSAYLEVDSGPVTLDQTEPAAPIPAGGPANVTDVALNFVTVEAPDIYCLFDVDCNVIPDGSTNILTFASMTGAGFLDSHLWPRGQIDTAGAGLFPYLYRIDLRELAGPGNPACITSLAVEFGPIVPLDYDANGSVEQGFVIASEDAGSVVPSTVTATEGRLTFAFSPPVCGDHSPTQDNGQSTLFFGLASPFRPREVNAELSHNWGDPLMLPVRAPEYREEPSLFAVPGNGAAGEEVQLIGSGYVPGGYPGTIRWNGTPVGTLAIPSGGAFSIPFTIPADASIADHTIGVCSLNPCATLDFEQLAETVFAVIGPAVPEYSHHVYMPISRRSGLSAPEPFSFTVDGSVQPSQPELPGLDGVTPRPLAAVRDPRGTVSTFVVNELVLQTEDVNELNRFLATTGGELLLTLDPETAGITNLPKLHLIRVDVTKGDPAGLVADVTALIEPEIESAGQFTFSSADAVGLFALAADEATNGLSIGVNWVGDAGAIPTSSTEAPTGGSLGGVAYSPDAYRWAHLARGTTQDIGVPETWTLLSRAGRLGNRVDVAVLDMGYFPNADFPTPMTFISVMPFLTDPRNVSSFDGRAPNHGTDVLQTVVARSDNNFGVVGVAAPVARPIAVFTSYDYFMSILAVIAARADGADVISMSYSSTVPGIWGWTIWPFEGTTAAVNGSGALLFASAGNNGVDVDGTDCFIVCWEHTAYTPCENAGVICVGGIRWDSQLRDPQTNFGSQSVPIYAPFTVYKGQAPNSTGGGTMVGFVSGTSVSAPYTAGVAALIWACDPSLSQTQVWEIMRSTAHRSPDRRVNRYVNAYAACLTAIGADINVTLIEPINGSVHDLGRAVRLLAEVGYVAVDEGTPLQVEWRVDGNVINSFTYNPGPGAHTFRPEFHASSLSAGTHTVMLRARAGSVVVERSATFTVVNTPPQATIDQPSAGATFCAGAQVILRGSGYDLNQTVLPESAYAWRSSINGNLGTGSTRSTSTLSPGNHTITLRVTDNGGLWDEDSIGLTILSPTHPDCVDLAPSATITSPVNGAAFYVDQFDGTHWYKRITFTGTIADQEDGIGELTVAWLSDRQGSLGTSSVNPTTGVTTITANIRLLEQCSTEHTITLRVTDTFGNVTEDQISISVSTLC